MHSMEMTMKALIAASLAATALVAYAGEDSTDRWGPGGTGPGFWDTPCGLIGFARATDTDKPCTKPLPPKMSVDEMRAWIAQHGKAMDEMMAKMNADHRAMMGGTRPSGSAAQ